MAKLLAIGFAAKFMSSDTPTADDFADRLSYKHTVNLLILYSFIVTAKTYIIGEPIQCWVPAHFTGNHEDYTNSYCWVRNTYYVPMNQRIPGQYDERGRQEITYYQWLGLILLVQALLFHLPNRIWHSFCNHSGLNLANYMEGGKTASTLTGDKLETALGKMAERFKRYLVNDDGSDQRKPGCSCKASHLVNCSCCPIGRRQHGTYLITRYLFVKLLFLANALGQFFAMDTFLGYDFHMYGIHVLRAAFLGESWSDSPRFPRVTLCDLNVRRLANVQRYTVQCVLPLNIFNEKLFLVIWFWFLAIVIITVFSILKWIMRLMTLKSREDYVKKHLSLKKDFKNEVTPSKIKAFMKYLGRDGLFVLRLLGHNVNTLTVSDVVCHMWQNYFNEGKGEEMKQNIKGSKTNLKQHDDSNTQMLQADDDDLKKSHYDTSDHLKHAELMADEKH